jgi:hypothetical protein
MRPAGHHRRQRSDRCGLRVQVLTRGNYKMQLTKAELEDLLRESARRRHHHDPARSSPLAEAAWEHGRVMPEADPSRWRQDSCGAWIHRMQLGRQTEFGWKVVTTSPDSTLTPRDVFPFHWRNAYDIANGRARCSTVADRSGVAGELHAGPPRNRDV